MQPSNKELRKVATASVIGATIEWYDFFLYGIVASIVFNKLYSRPVTRPSTRYSPTPRSRSALLHDPWVASFLATSATRLAERACSS